MTASPEVRVERPAEDGGGDFQQRSEAFFPERKLGQTEFFREQEVIHAGRPPEQRADDAAPDERVVAGDGQVATDKFEQFREPYAEGAGFREEQPNVVETKLEQVEGPEENFERGLAKTNVPENFVDESIGGQVEAQFSRVGKENGQTAWTTFDAKPEAEQFEQQNLVQKVPEQRGTELLVPISAHSNAKQ